MVQFFYVQGERKLEGKTASVKKVDREVEKKELHSSFLDLFE